MNDEVVSTEIAPEGYAIVTLNRPRAMNALSRELRSTLARTIDRLEADPAVRVLILTGAGKALCAGLDLKESGVKGLRDAPTGQRAKEAVQIEERVRSIGG